MGNKRTTSDDRQSIAGGPYMRTVVLLLALCGYAYPEGISTKILSPLMPITIQISQDETTTLQFPEEVNQIVGLGIVRDRKSVV